MDSVILLFFNNPWVLYFFSLSFVFIQENISYD